MFWELYVMNHYDFCKKTEPADFSAWNKRDSFEMLPDQLQLHYSGRAKNEPARVSSFFLFYNWLFFNDFI